VKLSTIGFGGARARTLAGRHVQANTVEESTRMLPATEAPSLDRSRLAPAISIKIGFLISCLTVSAKHRTIAP
jgi:hypothetical protein